MTEKTKGISKALVAIMIVIVLAASVGFYLLLTFPRNIVDFPVSFTIGADVERVEFSVPVLHGWVQVEVVVSSGNLVWTAKILRGNNMMWVDSKSQAGQTTYRSEWTSLASGNYNFTFAAAGFGSLEAVVKVTSKGGFW